MIQLIKRLTDWLLQPTSLDISLVIYYTEKEIYYR